MLVERAHHVYVQLASTVQDFVDAAPTSKAVRYVRGRETRLVHAEPDCLDRVRSLNRNGLTFVGFNDQGEHLDLVLLVRGRVFKVHQRLDTFLGESIYMPKRVH